MHILLLIFGALATIGTIIWRIQAAEHAARQIGDAAKTAANLPRYLSFRRKTGKRGSRLVQDPREAAVILMLEVARAGGEVSREQKNVMVELISRNLDFSEDDAEELIVQAAWVSQDEAGQDALLRRMVKLITASVSQKDIIDLDEMLVQVSEAERAPTADQLSVLQSFRSLCGLRV